MARAVHLRRAETTTRLLRATQSTRPVLCESCPFPPLGADSRTYSEQRRRFFPPEARRCSFFVHRTGTPRQPELTRCTRGHERPRRLSSCPQVPSRDLCAVARAVRGLGAGRAVARQEMPAKRLEGI